MIFAGLHGNWMGMGVVEMKSAGWVEDGCNFRPHAGVYSVELGGLLLLFIISLKQDNITTRQRSRWIYVQTKG